jgi:hypothetical protein
MHSRLAFHFGRESGIRQTSETAEQLQRQNAERRRQLAADRAQHAETLRISSREVLRARLEIAILKRDAALRDAPSPSAAVH